MEKIYCGSGVEKFDGKLIEITINLTDLPSEHIFEYNGKKYIKLKVQKKNAVDKFNKTHSVEVNTWKPEKKTDNNSAGDIQETDDLPF